MLLWTVAGVGGFLALVVVYDVLQRRHAILRNFPIIGHLRYILETIGPELRQYIVTSNDEERPFSRDQRTWIYASSKKQNNYFGFGTDNELESSPHYLILKHAALPLPRPPTEKDDYPIPCAKVLGGARGRKHAFRPSSVINISGMSFGSLSAQAVEAINRGCALADCLHNTGEGGVSAHHQHGAGLIWQIGTGYFGCRNADGSFDRARFSDTVEKNNVRAIEIKLSQGAKPGLGGVLLGAKVTRQIAEARGIPQGKNCLSPSAHTAFQGVDGLLDWVEELAELTGRPVGIKSAIGDLTFWNDLADAMADGKRGVDFIAVDGGEGGTGAAPLVFSDHVALPFKTAMIRTYKLFVERDLHQRVVFIGAGRLGFPLQALLAMAMGCDLVHVAREAMISIGCIQAQRCQTGHCPTGIATQNRWLARGLVPALKAKRLANYVVTLRKEMLQLSRACGYPHPALVPLSQFELLDDRFGSSPADTHFAYPEVATRLSAEDDEFARQSLQA